MRQPWNDKKTFQRSRDDKNGKSDRKCFRCGDPNYLIGECPKPPKDKKQRAFFGGSWSDIRFEEDVVKGHIDETCLLLAHGLQVSAMSSPNHPTSNIEDAFFSNFSDYIPASPDYVPSSPGNTYSSSSNNSFSLVPKASPTLSLFS
ncbi:retrovirus-related pol polyprotein from transposon TNT 1-94 [Tanacetum coccineum]